MSWKNSLTKLNPNYFAKELKTKLKEDWQQFVLRVEDTLWAMWILLLRVIGLGFTHTSNVGAKIYHHRFVERHHPIFKFFISIVAIFFSFFVWAFFQIIMSTFATVLGLVGLRTGDYDIWEQLLAWFSILLLCSVLPFVVSEYSLFQLTQILVFTTIVLGLNILIGFSGQISLGHGGFVSIGSFASAFVLSNPILGYQVPLIGGIVAGCVAAGLTGLIFGLPAVRVKGPHLALITLGLALSIPKILKSSYLEPYTGGINGAFITQPSPPEAWTFLNAGQWRYFIILSLSSTAIVSGYYILWKSRFGRALMTLAQGEEKALALGINVARYKLMAFSISAFYAGLGGVMMTIMLGYANPDNFTFFDSIDYLVAVSIGGLTSVFGSLLGGIFLAYQTDFNGTLAKMFSRGEELRWAAYGSVLTFFMIFVPRGISGEIRRIIYVMFFDIPMRRKSVMDPPPDYDYPYRNKHVPQNDAAIQRDQLMSTKHAGGCGCGQIEYEFDGSPLLTAHCHCRDCQRSSGAPKSTILLIMKSSFTLLKGEPKSYEFKLDDGNSTNRHFCSTCGGAVYSSFTKMPEILAIKAGSLVQTSFVKPTIHIWVNSKQKWESLNDGLPQFPKNPPMGEEAE